MRWEEELEFAPVLKLSSNLEEAMRMMEEIDAICEGLPGLDCGSCGAPSCRALAEDVVKGVARKSDCIFVMREQIQKFSQYPFFHWGICPAFPWGEKREKIRNFIGPCRCDKVGIGLCSRGGKP